MPASPPPRTARFLFWATGRRVQPEHRAWVAEQLARPDYSRRRLWPALAVQVLVLAGPIASALAAGSALRLVLPAVVVVFDIVVVIAVLVRRRPLSGARQRQLLAYHGVTADGAIAPTASVWDTTPLGKAGVALLSAQVLVFSSGVAVATDELSARRACHLPSAQVTAAFSAVVGRPGAPAAAAFGVPPPVVAVGTPLLAAREVDTGLAGVHVLAAYVRDASGHRLGPAVWRIIDPVSLLNPAPAVDISSWDGLARAITPSAGYSSSTPVDPHVARARDCARAAA